MGGRFVGNHQIFEDSTGLRLIGIRKPKLPSYICSGISCRLGLATALTWSRRLGEGHSFPGCGESDVVKVRRKSPPPSRCTTAMLQVQGLWPLHEVLYEQGLLAIGTNGLPIKKKDSTDEANGSKDISTLEPALTYSRVVPRAPTVSCSQFRKDRESQSVPLQRMSWRRWRAYLIQIVT